MTGEKMMSKLPILFATFLAMAGCAEQSLESGTADEARSMLTRAVAAVRADQDAAINAFNQGEDGFLDRDLYPFCIQASDGLIVAQGGPLSDVYLGRNMRELTDAVGNAYGEKMFRAAQKPEGEISEVSYMFPRPIENSDPVDKISFIQRVGDLACGVGYYQ